MTTAGGAAASSTAPAASRRAGRAGGPLRRLADLLVPAETHAWRWGARLAVLLPLAGLLFAVAVLALKAYPAIKVNGSQFFTGAGFKIGSTYAVTVRTAGVAHPKGSFYGAWPLIAGTLQTSAVAVVVALPISLGCAFALTERLPAFVSRPLGFAIELLAGVPSVVLGLWGVLTFGPWLSTTLYPLLADHLPDVPVLDFFKGTVGHGEGLLTGGLVLSLMIVPIITATTADLFRQVPALPKEGGEALGMTDAEVARRITLRWVRSGIIGATALGLGRALGETMAIVLTVGAIFKIAPNVYSPMSTIAAAIATQLDSALTDGTGFAVASYAELALVLAVLSVVVNLGARWVVRRTSHLGGPVGRAA